MRLPAKGGKNPFVDALCGKVGDNVLRVYPGKATSSGKNRI